MGAIESRLQNPCDYRGKFRHSRSAKGAQLDRYFRIFKNDYMNKSRPKIMELYDVPTNLETLNFHFTLPTTAFKNKRKNYESLQIYIKAFDSLGKQDNVQPTGNFTLEDRKAIFDSLANDSIRLLCGMYDDQKKHPKISKKIKKLDQQLKPPIDFTYLYAQDQMLLNNFDKFFKNLDKVIPYKKKNNKKKNPQAAGGAKRNVKPKTKKVPISKNKGLKATS